MIEETGTTMLENFESVIDEIEKLSNHENFDENTSDREKQIIFIEIQELLSKLKELHPRIQHLDEWNYSDLTDDDYLEILATNESIEIS